MTLDTYPDRLVRWTGFLVIIKYVVDVCVPWVENWISHCLVIL